MIRILNNWRKEINWSVTIDRIFNRPPAEDPVIDGLRGIASLAIVLFHSFYGVMFLLKDYDRITQFLTQIPAGLSFLTNTDKAVDLFFMVSGYLMGGALLREMARSGTINVKKFYVKRLFRIYPLFLLGILLYGLGSPEKSLKNLPYNLFFIDNFTMKTIIPVGWSLSIEMQFYLILPLIIFALWKMPAGYRTISLWALFLSSFAVIAATMVGFPVTYTTPMYQFHPDKTDPSLFLDTVYYQTYTRYGPLVLGLIWAWSEFQYKIRMTAAGTTNPLRSLSSNILALAGLVLVLICIWFPEYRPDAAFNLNFSPEKNLVMHVLHRGLFVLGIFSIVIHAQRQNGILSTAVTRFLGARFWRPFSQVVFPIYLFHFPMVAIAGILTLQTLNPASITTISITQLAIIFTLAATLSLIAGIFLHVTIEVPAIKFGERFRKRMRS